jgi:hypothetical protein
MIAQKPLTNVIGFSAVAGLPLTSIFSFGAGLLLWMKHTKCALINTALRSHIGQDAGGKLHVQILDSGHHLAFNKICNLFYVMIYNLKFIPPQSLDDLLI